jgi:HEAT repeat protein
MARDAPLSRLFEARARGDTAYLIESLRLEPEHAGLAASWLADDEVGEAIPALTWLLNASDPHARVAAIKALERLRLPPDVKPQLVEMAETDSDHGVRSWATSAIGSYGDRQLTPLLISLLADPSSRVSSAAVLALRKQGDPSALPRLRLARRSLRRSPLRLYVYRRLYRDAIKTLSRLEAKGP